MVLPSREHKSASPYPFPVTHIIGSLYFISSAVSAGILCYFIYYLRQDNMSVPLQLILPLVVSLISLVWITYSFAVHTFSISNPRTNFLLNVALFALWCASLALVGWKLNHMVLSRTCSIEMWKTDMGMMVCRIYKAMAAFLITGWLSSIASFILDWRVSSGQQARGAYAQMKDDGASSRQRGTYMEAKQGEDEGTPSLGLANTPNLGYASTPKI